LNGIKEFGERAKMSPEDNRKPTPETATLKSVSRLGPQLNLEGKLKGHEDLEIHGSFSGEVDLALHDLTIQKSGQVKAKLKVKNLFLHGQLEGQVLAERVIISETGRFTGEITACKISVQNGARFKGTIKISKDYQP
jgi:cytoskeletal protein CcmA (bactofilin family)